MNDDEKTLMLLQIIRVDGNISHLFPFGWSYVDILNKIEELKKKGFISISEESIKLSPLGNSFFHSISRKLGRRGLYKFLMPDIYSRIIQLNIDDIYIPRKKSIKEIENAN